MTRRACVVTGFGVASSLGVGRAAFVEGLDAACGRDGVPTHDGAPIALGSSGAARVETFEATPEQAARIAEVRGFDATKYLGDKGLRALDRLTKLLIVAARLALHDAGLKRDGAWPDGEDGTQGSGGSGGSAGAAVPWPERIGLVVSNAYGSLEAITELDRVALLEDARYINPSRFPLTVSNSAAGYVSIWEDLRALNVSVSDGNCGALDAVACAGLLLDQHRAQALLVGGAEAMSEALFLAFERLGALGPAGAGRVTRAAGPAVGPGRIGEGAALLVIEPLDLARARQRTPIAEVIGYGTSFIAPAHEASLVRPSPEALARAMTEAMSDARVTAAEVDLVVAGVAGLPAFDDAELSAIERVLGPGACVAAPKLVLGETLGAGGAMAMLASIAALQGHAPGPYVRGAPRAQVRAVLVTSMGYYGNASAVVLRAAAPSSG